MKRWRSLPVLLALATLSVVPDRGLRAQDAPQTGVPLPGLPGDLLAAFENGKAKFVAEEMPATGLGPVYNGRSCVECHSNPTPGGSATSLDNRVIRFGRQEPGRPFNPLLKLGGPALQKFGVADELPGCQVVGEVVPPAANVSGMRQPPPLFGLGLIQAIPDWAILANADPDDANGDGIAARPNIADGVIGRFGWKAAVPTVLNFIGLALVGELGITNHLFPNEIAPGAAGSTRMRPRWGA